MRLTMLAAACLVLAACSDGRDDAASGSVVAADGSSLPTPAGTPGSSVTGMPTDPPPQPASDVIVAAPVTDVAPIPTEAMPTGDAGAIPIDPATGLAATAAPIDAASTSADVSAAGNVVRDYMTALSSGSFAAAQQMWSTTPNDSAVLQLARGQAFAVDVLAPARGADPAPTGFVTVPVRVRGATGEDERLLSATYTVRRTADGAWRIATATVREEIP